MGDSDSTNAVSKEFLGNISSKNNFSARKSFARLADERGVNISRICITGGPCAGKTTVMAAIQQDLTQLGYKVLVVPEAATLIMKGGAMIVSSSFTEQQGLQFQKNLMRLQIALEDTFIDIAQMVTDQPVVLLMDRGLLDGSAYVSRNNWQALLDDLNMNTINLRDNRYDAILHMVTAADGAEKFYASLTNEARYESAEEARHKDVRLREAYMGHKHWVLIDNSATDFMQKINRAKQQVQNILGHNTGSSFYKKFLLRKANASPTQKTAVPIHLGRNQHFEESEVEETFINYSTSEGRVVEASIEKKGNNNAYAYTLKVVLEKKGSHITKKKSISASEYIELKQSCKKDVPSLHSNRLCTIDRGLYMIIDYYPNVKNQPMICIIQINENVEDPKRIQVPEYLSIEQEITDIDEFQPRALAKTVASLESPAPLTPQKTAEQSPAAKDAVGSGL